MGNAEAQSRRGNKSDFYVTPFPCIEALIDNIDIEHNNILDPCCGTGVIGKVIKKCVLRCVGFSFTEYDISTGKDFFTEENNYDVIIANPPYSIKNRFINHSLKIAKDIYMILPLNVCNYNEFHKRFLDVDFFLGKYLITPKIFMTDKETYNPKRGGISAYAWFHWAGVLSNKRQSPLGSYEKYIDLDLYIKGKNNES